MIRQLLDLFSRREKVAACGLVALLAIGAGLETLGIGLILPFISVLNDPEIVTRDPRLAAVAAYVNAESPREFLVLMSVALLALYIFKNTFIAGLNYAQHRFVFGKQARTAGELFTVYLRMPYVFHLHRNSAEIVRNLTTEIGGLFTGVVAPLFVLVAECLVLVTIIIFLLLIEPLTTLITAAVLCLGATGFYSLIGAKLRGVSERRARNSGLQIKWVNQSLGSLREIRLLGKEQFFIEEFGGASSRYAHAGRVFVTINSLPRLFLESLAICGLMLVLLSFSIRGGSLQKATPLLALFAVAALRVLPSLTRIMSAVSSIRFYKPTLGVVLEDLARSQDLSAASPSTRLALPYHSFAHAVELRKVRYRYPAADDWTVKDLDICIPKGSSVAIVGPSGSGKSTVVDLVLGLLTPDEGQVVVDGADIRTILPAWQRRCGYVPQTVYLLDDTVRRNVAFGLEDSEIDDEKVWRALSAARLADKFASGAEGLDTRIGERGVRISGGERQRLGIARALFHGPEILVFDEATSGLDHQTEREITETIYALRGANTVIIVAHRLTTVMNCDRVYFIRAGRIVDAGTFDELVASNADFRTMIGEEPRCPAA